MVWVIHCCSPVAELSHWLGTQKLSGVDRSAPKRQVQLTHHTYTHTPACTIECHLQSVIWPWVVEIRLKADSPHPHPRPPRYCLWNYGNLVRLHSWHLRQAHLRHLFDKKLIKYESNLWRIYTKHSYSCPLTFFLFSDVSHYIVLAVRALPVECGFKYMLTKLSSFLLLLTPYLDSEVFTISH